MLTACRNIRLTNHRFSNIGFDRRYLLLSLLGCLIEIHVILEAAAHEIRSIFKYIVQVYFIYIWLFVKYRNLFIYSDS